MDGVAGPLGDGMFESLFKPDILASFSKASGHFFLYPTKLALNQLKPVIFWFACKICGGQDGVANCSRV